MCMRAPIACNVSIPYATRASAHVQELEASLAEVRKQADDLCAANAKATSKNKELEDELA